ncbi:MAG TPA: ABC transporter permease [Streptosporangiaceae bacterium]|nr:ABC transporter permease [Streptosporangiaceae bacterium]
MHATTPASSPAGRLLPLFADVVRSELCKLRTVRSTFWALLAAVGFNVVTAALLGIFLPGHLGVRQQATIDSTRLSLGGLHLSQVAIGLLGVLAVSSEYSTGMIRATLAAVPQRRLMLTAKALVLTVATLVTGLAACFAAYLVFQAFLPAGDAMRTTLATPGVLRAVTGAGLYLAVLGLLGFGLAAIIRSSAGAVAVLLGALFVPSLLAALLPPSWQDTIGPYLPLNAGESAYTVQHQAHALQPWAGLGVFCLYAAAALAAGFILISRRDA